MERSEIEEIIRDYIVHNLSIEIEMSTDYECDREYVTANVTIRLGDQYLDSTSDSFSLN